MKLTTTISCLLAAATTIVAAPIDLEKRTSYNGGTTANDVVNKGMFWGRASCRVMTQRLTH